MATLGGGRVSEAPMGPLLPEFTDKEMHSTVSTSHERAFSKKKTFLASYKKEAFQEYFFMPA